MAKQFGPWQIIEPVSEGGQGLIYHVRHQGTQAEGALKRLKNAKRLDRFTHELEALRKVQHPNVVAVLDADVDGDKPYIVMEHIRGKSMQAIADGGFSSISLSDRISWFVQVCRGIKSAHELGVLHRDLKPDNVLVDAAGAAKVCDFGLAFLDGNERLTETHEQVGSRYYMAPECERGRTDSISKATDVYSLGKVLYFLISDGRVFSRERHRDPEYDLAVIKADPYLEQFARILDRMIVEDPSKRETDVRAIAKEVDSAYKSYAARHPIPGVPQTYKCVFCRIGTYALVSPARRVFQSNLGYGQEGNMGNEQFAFLECPNCGNAQRFKLKHNGASWFPNAFQNE